jgi:hypothetical protein
MNKKNTPTKATRALSRLYQYSRLVLFFAVVGWSNHSEAASPLAGIWRLTGNDARLGTYTGYLELRERASGSILDMIRVVRLDRYTHQDGRGVDLVWTGTVSGVKATGAQIQIALTRGDFITQVGTLKRTATDAVPLQVAGALQISGDKLTIRYTAAKDVGFSVTENASQRQASGRDPLWQSQRFERETHADLVPFTLDSTLKLLLSFAAQDSFFDINALETAPREYLFGVFADYHKLPALQPYVSNPLFQRAVHLQILDRTDYDYYQQNPNWLRVINKIVDPISLAETEVRANAFRASLTSKEKFYQDGLTREFVGAHGMVVRGIDSAGQVQPDGDGALWTGVYTYTQALRYKITGEAEALNNLRRSLKGLLTLMDITGQSGSFARTLRMHSAVVEAPWHAGSGELATFDWLEGGNNDMGKGLILGMSASWEVLPPGDPLRDAIKSHARNLLQLDQFQIDKGEDGAVAYLFAGITGGGFLADIYKGTGQTLLRNPLLTQYAKSGGGTFYLFGISDWSGDHLSLAAALGIQRLLVHTNSDDLQVLWSQAPAVMWDKNFKKLDHPVHAAFAIAAGTLDESSQKEAIDQVKWGLRSFPLPKHSFPMDHRNRADFVMSPFPVLPWKLDWLTNAGRQQAIRAYPLFEQAVDEYRWNNGHFMIENPGLGDLRVPGTDYLFLYWSARNSEIECLFNWAEKAFPTLFLPSIPRPMSHFQAPYIYRYYRDTKATVLVSSLNKHVYYQPANSAMLDVGPLSDWLAIAPCQ